MEDEDKEKPKGSCELIIYCHDCKAHFQLNPDMIALALMTEADIWTIYNYILTTNCIHCKKEESEK